MEAYSVDELKLVYRVLHRHLTQHTELMDTLFFEELQTYLHRRAQADGVDVSDHGAWDAWLGNEGVSCAVRIQGRTQLN